MYEMTNFSFGSLEFHIKKGTSRKFKGEKQRKKRKEKKKKKKKKREKKKKYTGKNGVKCSKISQKNRSA